MDNSDRTGGNVLTRLLIFSGDADLATDISTILVPFGWRFDLVAILDKALNTMAEITPAAVIIDQRHDSAARLAMTIRQLPPPLNGTPILAVGEELGVPRWGAGGHLQLPLDDRALIELLSQWAGPLGMHAMRAAPWSPRYRLTRLLGLDAADGMLLRLREALTKAVEPHSAKDEGVSIAHRLAGSAGICGFSELSAAWSRAEQGEPGALEAAIASSREVIVQIDRALA